MPAATASLRSLRNVLAEFDILFHESLKTSALAVFLDYDGTLTPIVNDPDKALLTDESRRVIRSLASVFSVGVVSGRSCDKLLAFLQIEEMVIAGSHGLDIRMPPPHRREQLHPIGEKARSALQRVQQVLNAELGDAPGYLTEDNVLCVSTHYRMVPPELQPRVHAAMEREKSTLNTQHSTLTQADPADTDPMDPKPCRDPTLPCTEAWRSST